MALAEGTRVYVLYDLPPPDLYHERLIMAACACGRGWHIVLSPDFDMFAEQISLENDDLTAYRVGVGLELPAGIGAGNAYRFRDLPGAAEMTQFRRDARHAAAAMLVPPGGGPGVVAPIAGGAPVALPVVAAGDGGAGGEDYVWVRVESEAGGRRGDLVALDGTEFEASRWHLLCNQEDEEERSREVQRKGGFVRCEADGTELSRIVED